MKLLVQVSTLPTCTFIVFTTVCFLHSLTIHTQLGILENRKVVLFFKKNFLCPWYKIPSLLNNYITKNIYLRFFFIKNVLIEPKHAFYKFHVCQVSSFVSFSNALSYICSCFVLLLRTCAWFLRLIQLAFPFIHSNLFENCVDETRFWNNMLNPIPCSGFDVVVILKPIFYCLFGKFDLNRLSTVEIWSLRGLVMSVFNLVVFSTRVSSPTHNIVRIWWYQNDSCLITLNILPCYLQIMTS